MIRLKNGPKTSLPGLLQRQPVPDNESGLSAAAVEACSTTWCAQHPRAAVAAAVPVPVLHTATHMQLLGLCMHRANRFRSSHTSRGQPRRPHTSPAISCREVRLLTLSHSTLPSLAIAVILASATWPAGTGTTRTASTTAHCKGGRAAKAEKCFAAVSCALKPTARHDITAWLTPSH